MKYFIIIVIVVISNTFLGVAKPMKNQAEIYFAGGCFWGTEHFLKQIRGVENTQVGYANSNVANPSYEQVCSGKTNAAETVKVVYDPKTVDLNLLLDLYFKTIDPTSLNQQGNDRRTKQKRLYIKSISLCPGKKKNLTTLYYPPFWSRSHFRHPIL